MQTAVASLAALCREETAAALAGGFVEDFFDGSASNLVMSLLDSKRLKPNEIEQLRSVLESVSKQPGIKKRFSHAQSRSNHTIQAHKLAVNRAHSITSNATDGKIWVVTKTVQIGGKPTCFH
jgi:penicillinase repressor